MHTSCSAWASQKFFQGATSNYAYNFQFADDAMQMKVHKIFYPYYTTKKMPHVRATVTKNARR